MRLPEPFVYRIDSVHEPPPIFRFIQRAGSIEAREMYGTFNMGVGFAVYVREPDASRALQLARDNGYEAWRAGTVHKQSDHKRVEITPLKMTFETDTLQVR